MKKKNVLITAMALAAGGVAVTTKEGKKLLKKMKKTAKKFVKEATEAAGKQPEEPVYDPLAGLSDKERALIQAVWYLVKDELEDDMTIVDVRVFMEQNDMVTPMLSDLTTADTDTLNITRHDLILSAYKCVADQMTDEERLDVVLTTIDRLYEEQHRMGYAGCSGNHSCTGSCGHYFDEDEEEDDYEEDDDEDYEEDGAGRS